MPAAPKRLNDLRKLRELVTFKGDDDGDPFEIEVWVVKLNDADTDSCRTAANAAKARLMIDRKNEDSEMWQSCYTQALLLGDNQPELVEWLSQWHIVDKAPVIQAEIAGEEKGEWAKDDYLDGLFRAWIGIDDDGPGLLAAWTARDEDPETLDPELANRIEEAVKVYSELERYEEIVSTKLEVERKRFCREEESTDIENLRKRIIERMLDERGNKVWVAAYDRAKIYYATRKGDDWRTRYFEDLREVDDTDEEFKAQIIETYERISVTHTEGKGSPVPQSSSPQPGSSGEEGTSDSSGPTAATG